jgi:hypothetical protein
MTATEHLAPPTDQATDGPPPARPAPWWPWGHVAAALAVGAALVVVTALVAHAATTAERRSTFTDGYGRQCTQVQRGDAIALSCAPKPFADRLADSLRTASDRAN